MKQKILLAAGMIVIFAAGMHWGAWRTKNDPSPSSNAAAGADQRAGNSSRSSAFDAGEVKLDSRENTKTPASFESRASQRVSMAILHALGKSKPERTAELLAAIEEVTKVELTQELLATLQQVLDGGEIDEIDYTLSVVEQREEKASVAFLVKALDHRQEDVRQRALMACEAVAGTIFTDPQAAKTWSESWKPNPAVAELFSPKASTPESAPISPKRNGPMAAAQREEGTKLSPEQNPPQKETPEN